MVRYDDKSKMPGSGKYAGEKLGNIPPSHLIWLYENNRCFGALKVYIEENLETLKAEVKRINKMKYR